MRFCRLRALASDAVSRIGSAVAASAKRKAHLNLGKQNSKGVDVDVNTDLGGDAFLVFNYGLTVPTFDDPGSSLDGKTPRSQWIDVDSDLRAEMHERLGKLGYESLVEWAGVENLEERIDGEDAVDPVVLEELRRQTA